MKIKKKRNLLPCPNIKTLRHVNSNQIPFMYLLLIALLFASCWCEDVVTQEGADKIKASGVKWEVVDPAKSVFKGVSKEAFTRRLQPKWPALNLPLLGEANGQNGSNNNSNNGSNPRLMQQADPLPQSFDGRKAWGKCIHYGRDQLDCRGCWAFGVANHLSDRFCIMGRDVFLSVQDLLECASGNKCCDGGSAENAYKHIISIGLVDEQCKPYDAKCNECRPSSCRHYKCEPGSAWMTADISRAKYEILEYGPITAIMDVYDDFAYYKSGVYYHSTETKSGVHSVTLLGWGVQNGMEYWICKNSWGDEWGDKSFFNIRMDDSGISTYMTSCKPLIEDF